MKKFIPFIVFPLFLLLFAVTSPKKLELLDNNNFVIPKSEPLYPSKPNITTIMPPYQDYSKIQNQLLEWQKQSPGLVEIGTYGNSTKNKELKYIRITNLYDKVIKKKVLITACIHGNEPLSTSITMSFIGTILSSYTIDPLVTELVNSRDIYFIPVVSPDSYPNNRNVDGVDPNRNFPQLNDPNKKSTPSLEALQKFFLKEGFNAVISGHTYGRVYLIPFGDTRTLCPNNADYERIVSQMQLMSQYRRQRACEMYGTPIYGTEIDWYHRHGAFAIVSEYGVHQNIPSINDTQMEFNRTYKVTLLFIKEAPLVNINKVAKFIPFF